MVTVQFAGSVAAASASAYVDVGSVLIITAVDSVVGSAGTTIAAGSKYRHARVGGASTVNQSAG